MSKPDRFDLEQQITDCWSVVDEIKTFTRWVFDSQKEPSDDEQMNYLIGLETIYRVKFEKLFNTYETMVHNSSQLDLWDDFFNGENP